MVPALNWNMYVDICATSSRAVQVDPIKPTLKAPEIDRSKLK
jgi:hypothetical protein